MWINLIFNGLVTSCILLLTTLGLTMIFGIMRLVNFAHGVIYMLGAYLGFAIVAATGNYWVGLIASPLLVALFGIVIERSLVAPIRKRPPIYGLLLTFGIALLIEGMVTFIWTGMPHYVAVPPYLDFSVVFWGSSYPVYRFFIIGITIVLSGGLFLLLEKTQLGITLRAASIDPEMLTALGINMTFIYIFVFALGCALAAIAGVVAGGMVSMVPSMGVEMLVSCFVVLVIGGLGSLRGAVLAAVVVGIVQTIGNTFFSEFSTAAVFGMMAIVLLFLPRGLLGEGRLD